MFTVGYNIFNVKTCKYYEIKDFFLFLNVSIEVNYDLYKIDVLDNFL